MAAFFGTTAAYDAWLMASVLPNVLFSSINSAITVTTVPLMAEGDSDYSPRSMQQFLNELFTVIMLASFGLIIAGELLAPWLLRVIAPGFHGYKLAMATTMTRIMLPTIIFWGIGGFVVGVLQAREVYLQPALSPVAVNVVRISSIIVFGELMGLKGIIGVAFGFLIAVMSQLVVTLPALRKQGLHLRFRWRFGHPLLKKMWKMAGPFFVTSSVGAVALIIDRILASTLVTGSIGALQYSYVLVQIPIGLLISSLATPIYTRLSQHHAHHKSDTFRVLALRGFRLVLIVIIPITLWFIVLREPLLRLLYQRGAFNNHSTDISAGTLLYFSLGLPATAIAYYLQRLFFATQDSRSPSRFSIVTIVLNVIGDLILVRLMHVDGLALATSLAGMVNAFLLTAKSFGPHRGQGLGFGRLLFGLTLAGATTLVVSYALRGVLHLNRVTGLFPLAGGLSLTVILSGTAFFAVLYALKFPETRQLTAQILSRLTRRVH